MLDLSDAGYSEKKSELCLMPESMECPTLSIVMPVYNASRYIGEAIDSLLRQTFTDFELIVIDDGSTDHSLDIVNSYDDPRIRIFRNEENKGIVFTRNRGLQEMRGRYYAPFDADDVAMPRKFEKQIAFMEQHPDYGLTGTWARHIDSEGKVLKSKWKLNARASLIPSIQLFRAYFIQSAVVFRKEAIAQFGYTPGFEIGEDYLLYYQISLRYKCENLPEYLIHYRIHPKSITQSNPQMYRDREFSLYRIIYSPLGINITPVELDTMMLIKYRNAVPSPENLRDIEAFLLRVLEANEHTRLYNRFALLSVVMNRWMKSCYNARRFFLQTIWIFVNSQITKRYTASVFGKRKTYISMMTM
jgi:glycosyltransferase involved in cell wall biosynthesis